MWKLIKADIICNCGGLMIFYGIFLVCATVNSIIGGQEEGLALVLLFLALMAVAASGAEAKNKKIRFMAALPFSVRQLGMYRLISGMAHSVLIFLLFFLSSLISQRGHFGLDYLWWLLTKAGSIFVFAGLGGLSADLYWCVNDKKWGRPLMRWIAVPVALGMVSSLLLYLFTIPGPAIYRGWLLPSLSEMFLTFKGAFGLLLFGLAPIALNVYVYERRRSYTEQSQEAFGLFLFFLAPIAFGVYVYAQRRSHTEKSWTR